MTPFSASNPGGMTDATSAHELVPAPSLPAFSIPTFGESHLRLRIGHDPESSGALPAAPRLQMAPFALAAHPTDAGQHVEDGPVAFSIASSLLGSAPSLTHGVLLAIPTPLVPQPNASHAAPPTPLASHTADDSSLAGFDELIIEPQVVHHAAPAGATVAFNEPMVEYQHGGSGATFDELAGMAPMPLTHQAHDLLFPDSTHTAKASETALLALLKSVVRTRIMALGRVPRQRSVHEWVFLMLAFAVMSLLAAPPLVAIFLSLNGVKP
ncbi:MAG: hypothetical protein H7123_02900 [Thermoleophilia bacterium]|nr:hypothetical protein [Thermoleophilia bacterium]